MSATRRINISSGRPLEAKANYSRALRMNDLVLQSGTTAIDRDGNILGHDVETQIDAILAIAQESMGAAGASFDDVMRARLYVKEPANLATAAQVFAEHFAADRTATTVIPIAALARPGQLIEIELEALDGAAHRRRRLAVPEIATALCVDEKVLLGGIDIAADSATAAFSVMVARLRSALEDTGSELADLVSVKCCIDAETDVDDLAAAAACALGGVAPVITLLNVRIPGSAACRMVVDAEAYLGAGQNAQRTPHPLWPAFSQTVCVDGDIYVSNIYPLDDTARVVDENDWAAQRERCTVNLEQALLTAGTSLDEVIVRRYFTAADTVMNSDYGDGRPWFKATRPTALGCRIESNFLAGVVLTLEAHALRGAGTDIKWLTLE